MWSGLCVHACAYCMCVFVCKYWIKESLHMENSVPKSLSLNFSIFNKLTLIFKKSTLPKKDTISPFPPVN